MKKMVLIIAVGILAISLVKSLPSFQNLSSYVNFLSPKASPEETPSEKQTIVSEESVIIKVVAESLPSVVTIGIVKDITRQKPVDLFDLFNQGRGLNLQPEIEKEHIDQNIGSGFIIAEDGIIITNKHVVLDKEATYKVVTNDNKEYPVEKIYRDPLNDLSILKIAAKGLRPLPLGDSSKLRLGQMAIAIGTPLGEFQNTITTGIVSGLSRGITAGSQYEGFVEKLDNVIQTDAAISPGNSGGPLLNSKGQAIGVNTAVAQSGQNIGFAIPINVVKELVDTFKRQGGTFQRPYIGVRYQMVDRETALRLEIVEGAHIDSLVEDSPGEKAGLQKGDIITALDGKKLTGEDNDTLARAILNKKVGETMTLTIWRNGKNLDIDVVLEGYSE